MPLHNKILTPQVYTNLSQSQIERAILNIGYKPVLISNPPGYTYKNHSHSTSKLLVILEGNMKVMADEVEFNCSFGDKILIPPDIEHSAVVGDNGCKFYWSEK